MFWFSFSSYSVTSNLWHMGNKQRNWLSFFENFGFLQITQTWWNDKNLKFGSWKIRIRENRIYYGDFDQNWIFEKMTSKWISSNYDYDYDRGNIFFGYTDRKSVSDSHFKGFGGWKKWGDWLVDGWVDLSFGPYIISRCSPGFKLFDGRTFRIVRTHPEELHVWTSW